MAIKSILPVYQEFKHIEDFINDNAVNTKKKNENLNTEDIYQKLMKKETKVLDTLNNVVEYKRTQEESSQTSQFVNMSLHKIILKTMRVMSELLNDLGKQKNLKEVFHQFTKDGRLIYVGIFIVIVSIFILLLIL